MPINLQVNTGLSTPIYRQIVDRVRLAVAHGELHPGDPLPSVRSLAQKLVINPNTVAKAFAELSSQGVIESRQGRGVFVLERKQVLTKTERKRRLNDALDSLVSETLTLDFSTDEIRDAFEQRLAQLAPTSNNGGKD
ncbi:MAG: GntR family transcriptional regulator [Planctomycetota bacterium]|jgi:GntR family transcriptional regulator